MKFADWPPEIHNLESQKKRMISAANAELTPLTIDVTAGTASFSGHHGIYWTTLNSCTCRDFEVNHLPCKHIYRLAYELCHIDLGCKVVRDKRCIIRPDPIVKAKEEQNAALNLPLVGKTYVLTGDFTSSTKKDLSVQLEEKGAKVLGSITAKTTYLVAGQNTSESKLRIAQKMKIPVLTEQELLDILK